MTDRRLLTIGLAGTIVTAICCFTPILVVGLSAIGLAGLIGGLDFVLFPALLFFLGLTGYALWRRRSS